MQAETLQRIHSTRTRDILVAGMNMSSKAESSSCFIVHWRIYLLVLLWQIANLSLNDLVRIIVVSASGDVSQQAKD